MEARESWTPWDDKAMREYIERSSSSAKCGEPSNVLSGIENAWVLIFNAGAQDEGVYTLQGETASHAAAYVLAFERTDDAGMFAKLLQAQGFDEATPLCWDKDELSAFCDAGEFEVSLVPQVRVRAAPPTRARHATRPDCDTPRVSACRERWCNLPPTTSTTATRSRGCASSPTP